VSWFKLDPQTLAAAQTGNSPQARPLSLTSSIVRGALGFCIVSIAGFVPWAIFGRTLGQQIGEAGMYVVCALVFIALAGLLLHPLIMGRGSLGRFYRLFPIAFGAYSVAWILGWMTLRGHPGSVVGLLAGTAIMGWIFTRAFKAPDALLAVIAVLFVANSIGYFVGGWVEGWLINLKEWNLPAPLSGRRAQVRTAMLAWGVFYGLGLGAGLGHAFHRCQREARRLLTASSPPHRPDDPTPA
jgi:hypothetical protein